MVHAVGPVGGRAVGLGTGKGARTAGQAAAGGGRGEGVVALWLEGGAGVQETHHLGRHATWYQCLAISKLHREGQLKVA